MCSTAALDRIGRNRLSDESWCYLGDLVVVSIYPIAVVALTQSPGSTSSIADPSVVGLVNVMFIIIAALVSVCLESDYCSALWKRGTDEQTESMAAMFYLFCIPISN